MLFSPLMIEAILKGKRVTRRPVKDGDQLIDGHTILRGGRLWLKVGRSYAIQPGRGKKGIGRLEVTHLSTEPLGDIWRQNKYYQTNFGAKAEGFETPADFISYWGSLYGGKVDLDQYVWVIGFRPIMWAWDSEGLAKTLVSAGLFEWQALIARAEALRDHGQD